MHDSEMLFTYMTSLRGSFDFSIWIQGTEGGVNPTHVKKTQPPPVCV
jgi:hypothetical protein